jgi:predicted AAA+ superfamily ATPase
VVSELVKNYYNRGVEADVFFWRDSVGHEVDLIIDEGERRIAVEVKSGETFAADFRKSLDYWRRLPGQAGAAAAVVYGGRSSFVRNDVAVYSWNQWG